MKIFLRILELQYKSTHLRGGREDAECHIIRRNKKTIDRENLSPRTRTHGCKQKNRENQRRKFIKSGQLIND